MSRLRYTLMKDVNRTTVFAGWTLYGLLLAIAFLADGLAKTI